MYLDTLQWSDDLWEEKTITVFSLSEDFTVSVYSCDLFIQNLDLIHKAVLFTVVFLLWNILKQFM